MGASSTPQHTTVTTVQLILPIRSWDSIETNVLDSVHSIGHNGFTLTTGAQPWTTYNKHNKRWNWHEKDGTLTRYG